MIEIKLIPYGEDSKKINEYKTAVYGNTYREVLGQLISGINHDTIDTENNMLILLEQSVKEELNNIPITLD